MTTTNQIAPHHKVDIADSRMRIRHSEQSDYSAKFNEFIQLLKAKDLEAAERMKEHLECVKQGEACCEACIEAECQRAMEATEHLSMYEVMA